MGLYEKARITAEHVLEKPSPTFLGSVLNVPLFDSDFDPERDIREIWYERLLRMSLRASSPAYP